MKMNQVVVPTLLSLTIVVAGIFAFIPVQEAATVHTVVMANTMRMDQLILSGSTSGADLVITCPSTSDGCRILELYIGDAAGGGTIILGALTANIDGNDYIVQSSLNRTVDAAREAIAGVSGSTFGPSDTLTVANSGTSTTYDAVIFIEVEGNTIATATFG